MTVNISYFAGAGWQFFDDNGNPLSGGKLYTYLAGTTTPAVTYTSSLGTFNNPNPIILDAAGRPPEEVWLTSGVSYKFVVTTSANVTIRTYDNLCSVNDFSSFANTTDPALGDALVGFRQSNASGNLTGAVGKTVHQKLQESVSVKDFGAVGDGTTNDRNALQAAITYATLNNVALYVPTGTYYVPNNSTSLSFTGNLTMYGDGMYNSVLFYNDSVTASRRDFISSSAAGNIIFDNLCISSNWGLDANYAANSQLIELHGTNANNALVTNCRFTNSRFSTLILNNFNSITVNSCVFNDGVGDGCRLTGSQNIVVTNCQFNNINDDSISVHTINTDGFPSKADIVIANNKITNGQGIGVLGGKHVSITGNVLTRVQSRGIYVGNSTITDTEGVTSVAAVTITGNVITDVFNGSTFSTVSGNGGGYIQIDGFALNNSGVGYVTYGNGSGGVVQPYPYLYNNPLTSSTENAGNWFLNIVGNVCARTLGPVAKYSDYGYGVRLGRQGPVDPQILYSSFDNNQIIARNYTNGLNIADNVISGGIVTAIYLVGSNAATINYRENVNITNNIISDISHAASNYGIKIDGPGIVKLSGNNLNLDPYNVQAQRLANGKWSTNVNNCVCIYVNGTGKIIASNNVFKNTGTIYLGTTPQDGIWQKNILICQPADAGYNANNIGIGDISWPAQWDANFIIEDGNPSSATFNTVLNVCLTSSVTLPTTGTYVLGLYVPKLIPVVQGAATSQYVVQGWVRLTTGSAHVLNTDWAEVRTLTGT